MQTETTSQAGERTQERVAKIECEKLSDGSFVWDVELIGGHRIHCLSEQHAITLEEAINYAVADATGADL